MDEKMDRKIDGLLNTWRDGLMKGSMDRGMER